MLGVGNLKISAEAAEHGDILQSAYVESYYNVTLKNVDLLAFVEESCPDFDFLVHADDDILLVPHNVLFQLMLIKKGEVSMSGCMMGPASPNDNIESKWYANSVMVPESFPAFFSGAAIFYRADVVKAIAPLINEVPLIHLSDVWLGQLVQHAGINSTHMEGR